MSCIMALFSCEEYLMLGSVLSCACMWIEIVSHLRFYVTVTVCCQSRRNCSEEMAVR
jgi:hypothetical protein